MLPFPESISIDELRNMLETLRKQGDYDNRESCQEKLTSIREAMEKETLQIAEGFRLYGETLHEYYSKFPPFQGKTFALDLEDFIELIGHSVVIGNYFLISQWGVDYPLLSKQTVLAHGDDRLPNYISAFKKAINEDWEKHQNEDDWPKECKQYWEYLIKEWEDKLS